MRRIALLGLSDLLACSAGRTPQQPPAAPANLVANAGDTSWTATGLTNGHAYRFSVTASTVTTGSDHVMDDDVINHRYLFWNAGDGAES